MYEKGKQNPLSIFRFVEYAIKDYLATFDHGQTARIETVLYLNGSFPEIINGIKMLLWQKIIQDCVLFSGV